MAKKAGKSTNNASGSGGRGSAAAKAKAKETCLKIEGLAEMIVDHAKRRKSPKMEIPIRALSNVNFNPKKAILEMGDAAQTRQFFDLSMAKKFMQTILIASHCKNLIDEGKTSSIRGLFYLCKHDVAGTYDGARVTPDHDDSFFMIKVL